MVITATPNGTTTGFRLYGWCSADAPTCAHGHVLYGVHARGELFVTCQHRDPRTNGRSPDKCSRKCYVVGMLDRCIVIDLSDDEFELGRRYGKLGEQLKADLRALIEAAVLVTR